MCAYLISIDEIPLQIKCFSCPLFGDELVIGNDKVVKQDVIRHGPNLKTDGPLKNETWLFYTYY